MELARGFVVACAVVLAGCARDDPGPTAATASRTTTTIAPSSPSSTSSTTTTSSAPTSSTTTTTSMAVSTTPAPPVATSMDPPAGSCTGAAAPARYDHVVWIWMENHRAQRVLGDTTDTPFEHELADRCGSSITFQATGSPSLPNYIAAITGDTQGIHDDDPPAVHPVHADNLFRQVRAQGGVARSYAESMDGNCVLNGQGRYAVKHNPQAYLAEPADRDACQRDDVPLGTLSAGALHDDLAAGRLPTFAFITPDLCNDTHDCDVATGDRWLADWVSLITASDTYQEGKTAIFVVWDEPTPMPLLVVAPSVQPGTTSTLPFDHYSLLRTTEGMLGIEQRLAHAETATGMREVYNL